MKSWRPFAPHPGGLGHAVAEVTEAVRKMPVGMHKIGLVFFFQWYAMFIYCQFVTLSIGGNGVQRRSG